MAVVKKTFSGTITDGTATSVELNGIMENSTVTLSFCTELTLHFLNALYQTLSDAGYEDITLNTDEYYLTIFGERFYFPVSATTSGGGTLNSVLIRGGNLGNINGCNCYLTSNNEIRYSITIRGDNDHVGIYIASASSNNMLGEEQSFFHIFKMKNIIEDSDSLLFLGNFINSVYSSSAKKYVTVAGKPNDIRIKDKDTPYTFTNITFYSDFFSSNYFSTATNESNTKFPIVPMLAAHGCYLIPSMIGCSVSLFTNDKYYKIGDNTYYCNNGCFFKVS